MTSVTATSSSSVRLGSWSQTQPTHFQAHEPEKTETFPEEFDSRHFGFLPHHRGLLDSDLRHRGAFQRRKVEDKNVKPLTIF